MADSWWIVTDPLDPTERKILLKDNRDGLTHSIGVHVARSRLEVAQGNVSGIVAVHKFGLAPDFDTGDNTVAIWDGANDDGANLMPYIYSATADIDRLSSSSGSDTEVIRIEGLDTNGTFVSQDILLTGQTAATLTTSLKRVFRMWNVGSVNLVGTVYCFVNVATTGGVPNTIANTRAIIAIGNGQTLMALYTVPTGKKAYMVSFYGALAGARKAANYVLRLRSRPNGEVFTLDEIHTLTDDGTSHFNHKYQTPKQYLAGTDIEMTGQIADAAITGGSLGAGFELVLIND